MGLLSDGTTDQNFDQAYELFEALVDIWEEHLSDWGYKCEILTSGIDRSVLLAEELIFTGKHFPETPGPFKRAAALAILFIHLVEVRFHPSGDGVDEMSQKQVRAWKGRLSLILIRLVIYQMSVHDQPLKKEWWPPSIHLQVETLEWLRWLELPVEGGTLTPGVQYGQNVNLPAIDTARLHRSILSFALIIEQSYYLSEEDIQCELMGSIGPEIDVDDPIIGPDAYFRPQNPDIDAEEE